MVQSSQINDDSPFVSFFFRFLLFFPFPPSGVFLVPYKQTSSECHVPHIDRLHPVPGDDGLVATDGVTVIA
jgi:hypothetical protein